MRKRMLSLFLMLCMVASMITAIPVTVLAATSGTCGYNLTWTLDDEGTLIISGTGDMWNWNGSESPWCSNTNIKKVEVKQGVTSIGNYAFSCCSSLESINFPDSVTSIGDYAFWKCSSLISGSLPDSVTSIGWAAFSCCSSLESINFPDSVTSIGSWAFSGCSGLTSINLPDSVTSIGDCAFLGCSSLASISLPDSVTSIGDDVFLKCSSLTSISLPDSVTSIGDYAFWKCSSLTSISLPDSVTSIGDGVLFRCSSLTNISFPDSITSIGSWAFCGCSNLKDVYYSGAPEQWKKINIGNYNSELTNAKIHYNRTSSVLNYTANNTGVHLWLDGNANREMYLTPGRSYEASIGAYPASAYPTSGATWHSTNPDVATVSQKGLVTGIKEGHANVYITTADGITSELAMFVSNELLHVSDALKCSDNMRLLSYISVAMTNKIASQHLAFVTTTDEVQKENYAKQLIEQYNLLISARKLGEENYSKVYKYNPANWETIRTVFGMKYNNIDVWYQNVSAYLDKAKGNPEAKCDYVAVTGNGNGGGTFSLSGTSAVVLQSNGSGTAYTAEEFYGLFADKAFADAVLFSLGADKENPDWSIVTKEAVEGLTAVYCDEDRAVSDITGVSNLKSLKYLNLANQNVHTLPDEITQLSDLELINLFNNGITVYPSVLNDVSSLKQAVLSYNLLTDVSDISDRITVELSGNLLDTESYQQQRYLYSDMPIVYSADTKLTDVIKLRDMYGIVYDYNGDEPQTEGNLSDGSITAAVNGSSNPNARIKILADILDTSAYTEASFNAAFPDGNVRSGVLAALGMDSESVDYSKITQAALAGISQCTITGAENLTGIELLKGLNSLDLEQSTITSIPIVLEQLNNLQQLTFRGSALTSLDGLSKIKNLTQLDISQCTELTDVSELKALTKLEKLYADEAGNAEILNQVSTLSNIKTLSVFGNCITDISPIMDNNYDYLNISGTLIDENIFDGHEFRALQNNCGMLVYSPQNTGLIKNITATENRIVVTVENNTGTIFENIALYTAVYRDDKLVEVKKNDVSALGGYDNQTFDIAFDELKNSDSVKCFIWGDNIQSVTDSKGIVISESN